MGKDTEQERQDINDFYKPYLILPPTKLRLCRPFMMKKTGEDFAIPHLHVYTLNWIGRQSLKASGTPFRFNI